MNLLFPLKIIESEKEKSKSTVVSKLTLNIKNELKLCDYIVSNVDLIQAKTMCKSVKQSGGTKTLSLDNIKVTSGACKNSKNSVEKHLTL